MMNQLKSVELFLALGLATTISVSSNPIVNAEEMAESVTPSSLFAQGGDGHLSSPAPQGIAYVFDS